MYKTHGLSKLAEYHVWKSLRSACYCKKHNSYPTYGEKGIGMCKEWKESFIHFYKDMGKRPLGHYLNRIDKLKISLKLIVNGLKKELTQQLSQTTYRLK